jgi:cyclopropane fatty-acyl-phospholipid synthase-like methyltransferase
MNLQALWEKNYKQDKYLWGLSPDKIVVEILKYKNSGEVLDIGVGYGRNAIFLVQNGFDVTGVDISKTAIELYVDLAKKKNLKVKAILSDIENFKMKKIYDVVLSTSTLHFLKEKEVKKVFDKIKICTKSNGLNVIEIFTKNNSSKDYPYLFENNELKAYYDDWKILSYNEYQTDWEKHGEKGKLHKHEIAYIMAQKP